MGKNELTKEEAFELIGPVVDDEATDDERRAFMDYIAKNSEVRREFESIKKIKSLVGSRCPRAKAPDSLQAYVKKVGRQETSLDNVNAPIYDLAGGGPANQKSDGNDQEQSSTLRRWMFSVAAVFLVAAAFWGFFSFYGSSTDSKVVYNIEEYAYEHFKKHDGQFVQPTISTASLGAAEIQMAQNYGMKMTIPALENAEFKGVVYGEFVPNFEAPMLEYFLPGQDQYIYIFAFSLDKLKDFGQLDRYEEAVKACNKPEDFHIRNVNGKHVVSWKWDNVWYAAISNHNGNTLASLVKPLQYNPDTK